MSRKMVVYVVAGLALVVMVSGCAGQVAMASDSADEITPVVEGEGSEVFIDMANPASVYCEEQGGTVEMREGEGGVYGMCVFADGSEIDEWEFFRSAGEPDEAMGGGPGTDEEIPDPGAGEAHSSTPPAEEIADWWGIIGSTEFGDQFDDYFERQDLGQLIYFGIESHDPAVQAQIEALRDTGKIVHLYGTLLSNVLDYNGSQILVSRIEVED